MKKILLVLFCCLVLCLTVPGALAQETYEVTWWYNGSVSYGTLQQALDAAEAGQTNTIYLKADIDNAAYTLSQGHTYILFEGHTLTAAPGKSAFTLDGAASINLDLMGGSICGSEACITVNTTGSLVLNESSDSGSLVAANDKPAIVLKSGKLVMFDTKVMRFSNASSACDICYEGGVLDYEKMPFLGASVYNASGKTIGINTNTGDSVRMEDPYFLSKDGQKVTQLLPGDTCTIDGRFSVTFAPGKDAQGTMAPVTNLLPYASYTIPECSFTPRSSALTFSNWISEGGVFVYSPGDVVTMVENLQLEAEWTSPVMVNGIMLPDGYYLASGSSTPSTTLPASGSYVHFRNGVLTLHDFDGETLDISTSLTMVLEGSSSLVNDNDYDSIDIEGADVIIQGSGSLYAETYLTALDIFAGSSLEIKSGKLTLNSEEDDVVELDDASRMTISATAVVKATVTGEGTADGFDLEDNSHLYINGGSLTISATDHGMELDENENGPGLIINGGTINITAGDDAIDSNEGVIINGGTLNLTAEDNGIDADEGDITINGGNITIRSANRYGIDAGLEDEPHDVIINGGKLNITAAHFGIHAVDDIIVKYGSGTVKVTKAEGLAIAAMGNLVGDVFENKIRVDAAEIDDTMLNYETIGSADGLPLRFFKYNAGTPPIPSIPSSPSLPQTGDSTPLAMLAALMALSLCGVFFSRRRSA